jgi:hypothetical protein
MLNQTTLRRNYIQKKFSYIFIVLNLFIFVSLSHANTIDTEKNFSGSYTCKGNNSKVGDYAYTLNLKLNKTNSHDEINIYDLTGQTENSTFYTGNAVAIANRMSLAFRLSDHKENVFGSGSAHFKLNADKLWTFTSHYYEPNETGSVTGSDICTQIPPKKLLEEVQSKQTGDDTSVKKASSELTTDKTTK